LGFGCGDRQLWSIEGGGAIVGRAVFGGLSMYHILCSRTSFL
jgi:hypothetical protein